MTQHQPIDYANASPAVRAVFDEIRKVRGTPDVNNFWKYLAHDPQLLKRTWESLRGVMSPGALSPMVKEMLYLAVSISNGCNYCIASHGTAARQKGMSEAMYGELLAVVGMANQANRLVDGYRVPIDAAFNRPPAGTRVTVRRQGDAPPARTVATVRRGPPVQAQQRTVASVRRLS